MNHAISTDATIQALIATRDERSTIHEKARAAWRAVRAAEREEVRRRGAPFLVALAAAQAACREGRARVKAEVAEEHRAARDAARAARDAAREAFASAAHDVVVARKAARKARAAKEAAKAAAAKGGTP